MSRPRRGPAPRGVPLNSGLPVLARWAPASKRAKSRLSAASACRLPVALRTISGASIATTIALDVRRERGADLLVAARGGDVHQPAAVVQHCQAGGLALAPCEVDADEVHAHTLPHPGTIRAPWRAGCPHVPGPQRRRLARTHRRLTIRPATPDDADASWENPPARVGRALAHRRLRRPRRLPAEVRGASSCPAP